MVNTNEALDEKKETTRKKATPKKKAVVTGVWPCKINGCNKQFAREADLKRHQRTTKLHSMPGFACSQCDATFTRTDALRRHHRSRHNGIIVEPAEQEKKGDDDETPRSTGSKSRSRSATPSSKDKVRTSNSTSSTVLPQPGTAGPSSYYRQHTATTSSTFVPPRASQPVMDPQYAQVGLPTSATRLNSATNWAHPHPWPEGPPQMGPISYHSIPGQHPVYYASPYYRPNGVMIPHPQPPHPELAPNSQGAPNGSSSSHTPPEDHNTPRAGTPIHSSNPDTKMTNVTSHAPNEDSKPPFVIDPSLDSSVNTSSVSHSHPQMSSEQIKAISLEITQAAMEAVLESAKAEVESRNSRTPNGMKVQDSGPGFQDGPPSKRSNTQRLQQGDNVDGKGDEDEERAIANQLASEDQSNGIQGYGRTLERPEPMEHMLTEDGEPMLNPAELLTQESLASPPPS